MLQFPTFLRVYPTLGALESRSQTWEAVAGNVGSWKGRLQARNGLWLLRFLVSRKMKRVQIMVRIAVSVQHCRFWNICNICCVLGLELSVEYELEITRPTAPATTSMRHRHQNASSREKKAVFFCILTIVPLLMVQIFAPNRSFYWFIVKSLPTNYFFNHSDDFRLHFYSIHQCQLTISWLTLVTCGANSML